MQSVCYTQTQAILEFPVCLTAFLAFVALEVSVIYIAPLLNGRLQ